MRIIFLSSNEHKIAEVQAILSSPEIEVQNVSFKIDEIQSDNMTKIAEDKALKAFKQIGRPILVEQTGLLLKDFRGLPGGLTQVFWDALEADDFCGYFSKTETGKVVARTILAYCDGKKVMTFEGEIEGVIVEKPRGNRAFQWDCVFQPNGYEQTFAEMGDKKNDISMRKLALAKLREYLEGE